MTTPDDRLELHGGSADLWWSAAPALPGERVGLIGTWRPGADPVGLLHACCARLRTAGCTLAIGPMDGSTWKPYRLTTWRGEHPRFALEPDTPDDWPGFWLAAGFTVEATYYSALVEPILLHDPRLPAVESRLSNAGVSIRELDPAHYDDELRRIHRVALAAFAGNHLYTPLPAADFVAQYQMARPLLRPGLCWLAERGGEAVGFVFTVPDAEQQRRGAPVDTLIVKTLAVLPERALAGLGKLLTVRAHHGGAALGLTRAIHALMHEGNHSRNLTGDARVIRRYSLFRRPLA
jgi:hypothetical protein